MDKCKTRLGYNAIPSPYTGNFMPPKPDLVYPSLDDFVDVNESVSESIVEKPTVETNEPKTDRKESGALIIEDWVSDSDEENVSKVKTVEMFNKPSFAKINFVKSTKQVKSPRKTSVDKNRQNIPSPRGNRRNWNQQMSKKLGSNFEMFNKACHVCGSFDHLKNDCNNWSGLISLNTARPVNTVQPRTTVNNAGPMKNVLRVNTSRPKEVRSAVKGNKKNVVKASALKTVNEEVQLQALVDWKKVIITESIVRRDLHLEDAEGVDFYDTPSHTKKIFANMRKKRKDFSGTVTPLFSSMPAQEADMGKGSRQPTDPQHTSTSVQPSTKEPITIPSSSQPKKTQRPRKAKRATDISQSSGPIPLVADETVTEEWEDRMDRAATTASSLEVEQDSGNINRTQSMATLNAPIPQGTGSGSGPRL
ncbi:hypothetical protein Tco_0553888 [Tanacetum coccineum]